MNKSPTLLTLLSLICVFTVYAGPQPKPVAQKGIIDLRNYDFKTSLIKLEGEIRFYPQQLISPGEKPIDSFLLAPFPSLWKNIQYKGKPLPSLGYGSYEMIVLLPGNKPVLGLEIPDVYSSYALYVNDTLLSNNGIPGNSAANTVPFWNTKLIRLFSDRDSLHLIMQVSNFTHAKGGTYKPFIIGELKQLASKKEKDSAFDLILMGCLFMGGLFFLGLYLFGRRDAAILYFSLFCILYSYRMIGTDRYVLHTLFPELSWWLTIKLEYLVLSSAVAMFVQYTRFLFPEDCHKKIIWAMMAFCLLFTGIVLVTEPVIFTGLLEWFLLVMFFFIGYASYVYIQAARRKRSGSVYALLGTGVLMIIFLLSNLHYFGVLDPLKGWVFACYILFFFLQSLALSHRFAQSFRKATSEATQGLKIKTEFLSTMSHEIRTPLNAVIGMTHVLQSKNPRPDQQEHLDVLLFSANNLLSIVNNILDYSKIEDGKINFESIPMDMASIARKITAGLRIAASEKGVELRLEADPAIPSQIIGDPTRFSQVINNLVQNAVKFTPQGWVLLKLEITGLSEREVTIRVTVQDNGIGIAPDKQRMIFERFSQAESSTSRSYGGTGLGLAISKKILELQGSELQLNSTPGKGSSFFFSQTFPVVTEKAEVKTAGPKEKNIKGIGILLVEDHPFNVVLAKTILEGWGAEVEVATNGQEALDKLNAEKHRLVLMDLHMPVMDGYEATERLRNRGETLPIIALTANTPGEAEAGLLSSGLTDIIVKPFNPDDLYQLLIRYLPEDF